MTQRKAAAKFALRLQASAGEGPNWYRFSPISQSTDAMLLEGVPAFIRSDNGPEMVAKMLRQWLSVLGAKKRSHRALFNLGEWLLVVLQRQVQGRTVERRDLLQPSGSHGRHRAMTHPLQQIETAFGPRKIQAVKQPTKHQELDRGCQTGPDRTQRAKPPQRLASRRRLTRLITLLLPGLGGRIWQVQELFGRCLPISSCLLLPLLISYSPRFTSSGAMMPPGVLSLDLLRKASAALMGTCRPQTCLRSQRRPSPHRGRRG